MHRRRRFIATVGGGIAALAGCSAPGGGESDPTSPTRMPESAPALSVTTVDDTYLRLTHTGGEQIGTGDAVVTVEFRVAGFATERLEHRLDAPFAPGDELFVYRTETGAVTQSRTEPAAPLPMERVATVTVRGAPGDPPLLEAGPIPVGVAPVDATFSASVVDEVLVRVTHGGGDPLLAGQTAVVVENDSPNGQSFSRRLLESRFAPGDHAWFYLDDDFLTAVVVGQKPNYDYPLLGTTRVTFVDPLGDAIGTVTATVGR